MPVPVAVLRPTPEAAPPLRDAGPQAAPAAGQLRRERRTLLRLREQRIRDLGGLVLEMYRRDEFREDLVYEQCGRPDRPRRPPRTSSTLLLPAARAAAARRRAVRVRRAGPLGPALLRELRPPGRRRARRVHELRARAPGRRQVLRELRHGRGTRRVTTGGGSGNCPRCGAHVEPDRSTASSAACASRAPGSRPPSGRRGSSGCAASPGDWLRPILAALLVAAVMTGVAILISAGTTRGPTVINAPARARSRPRPTETTPTEPATTAPDRAETTPTETEPPPAPRSSSTGRRARTATRSSSPPCPRAAAGPRRSGKPARCWPASCRRWA